MAIAGLAALSLVYFRGKPPLPKSIRVQFQTPGPETPDYLAISPDGRLVAFVTTTGGPKQIWIRALDSTESHPLAGTEGASAPFWSPDSRWIGFFAARKLLKIPAVGGPTQTLCDAAIPSTGTWNRDGVILFSDVVGDWTKILRVSANGGTTSPVANLLPSDPGAVATYLPWFLPDGVHFLYSVGLQVGKSSSVATYAGSLNGAPPVRLVSDAYDAVYAPPVVPGESGYLVFARVRLLMAQPFDPKRLKITGPEVQVAENVGTGVYVRYPLFGVSSEGTLAYITGSGTGGPRERIWIDRDGKRLGTGLKLARYSGRFSISPDEKTIAASIIAGMQSDIWVVDVARGVSSRFTFRPGLSAAPIWSPDGRHVAFSSNSDQEIVQKEFAGNGKEEVLFRPETPARLEPTDWSPDGRLIVFWQLTRKGRDLWLLPLDGKRKPIPYLQTGFTLNEAHFSPDGKWMAYQSDESGQDQVYVQSIPATGAKYQISTNGGTVPRWRRDGKELYYRSQDLKMMAAPIKIGSAFEVGSPQALFQLPAGASVFEPSRDGKRFLVSVVPGNEGTTPITVVTNWQAGLKK